MRLKVLVGLFGALTVLGAPRFEQVPLQVSPEAELAAPKLVPVFVAKPLCTWGRD